MAVTTSRMACFWVVIVSIVFGFGCAVPLSVVSTMIIGISIVFMTVGFDYNTKNDHDEPSELD